MRDQYHDFYEETAIIPQIGDADVTGNNIDTRGYDSLTFGVAFGEISSVSGASYWVLRMQHTDASALGAGPSDYANCEGSHILGSGFSLGTTLTSGIILSIDGSAMSMLTTAFGYRGGKRYVRLYLEEKANLSTITIGAVARKGRASQWPASDGVSVTL